MKTKYYLKKLAPYISTLEKIISENSYWAARPYNSQTMSDMLHLAATDISSRPSNRVTTPWPLNSPLVRATSWVTSIPMTTRTLSRKNKTPMNSINFNLAMMIGCTPAGMTIITKRKDRIIAQGAPTSSIRSSNGWPTSKRSSWRIPEEPSYPVWYQQEKFNGRSNYL